MNITLEKINLKDPQDLKVLRALTNVMTEDAEAAQFLASDESDQETTTVATKPAEESAMATTKDTLLSSSNVDKDTVLSISARQAESVMGLKVQCIRKNAAKMSDYRALISEHPDKNGRFIVGERLKNEMRANDLAALQRGSTLRVPVALSTWLINAASKAAFPEKPPKFSPHNEVHQRRQPMIRIFDCKPENGKKLFYYLTLVEDLKETRPQFHMAIENLYIKRYAPVAQPDRATAF